MGETLAGLLERETRLYARRAEVLKATVELEEIDRELAEVQGELIIMGLTLATEAKEVRA